MTRDSKGRFCSSKSIKNESSLEYQNKLKEAIKVILDCITKEKIDTACFSYVLDYTGRKTGYGFMLDDNTYRDLSEVYTLIK